MDDLAADKVDGGAGFKLFDVSQIKLSRAKVIGVYGGGA